CDANVAAVAYVRPYDIDIARVRTSGEQIEAVIRHIQGAGAVARLELERLDSRELVDAELTRERYRELALATGEKVFIRPRNLRVFAEDYSI
ncbi:MAG TPA: TOBE-like domain-containing protein, partial [Verrucomicrobiae bacterium]|nr:TOBE-like domain-containing protein [Verrucomicrobiae bacterium]